MKYRPQECVNANCINVCSIAQYEGFKQWFGNNPINCPAYVRGEYKEMTGLWLIREYLQSGVVDRQFACSNCDYTSGHVMTDWKYCPVCGSRNFLSDEEMKREKEREEKLKNIPIYDFSEVKRID